jgi:hypothetical protein
MRKNGILLAAINRNRVDLWILRYAHTSRVVITGETIGSFFFAGCIKASLNNRILEAHCKFHTAQTDDQEIILAPNRPMTVCEASAIQSRWRIPII